MKRLILQRHAKTEPWYEGVDDHGRALLERGRHDAVLMAEELLSLDWVPDLALVSTARRARETWAGAVTVFPATEYRLDEGLYLAGAGGLESFVSANDGAGTLIIIGHNPGIHDFALSILREAGSHDHQAALRLTEKFPTGCAALFEAEEDGPFIPPHFKLVDVIRPKELRPTD